MKLNHSFSMRVRVTGEMTARFFGCEIHPLYATFAAVEHCEYASRQAIRPFLAPDEDAVGSAVEIRHRSAAPVGAVVTIVATIVEIEGSRVLCRVEVRNGEKIVAEGTIEQRVIGREKLQRMIAGLYGEEPANGNVPGEKE